MLRRMPALTLPHVQRLDVETTVASATPEWWDDLRASDSVFGIPDDRAAWLASITNLQSERAQQIATVVAKVGARKVVSYGVGGAGTEYRLVELAEGIQLTCTDNAPRTIERLRRVFPEAEIVQHDLATDEPLTADLHILSRVDTEFTDRQLEDIIRRFQQPLLLIPGELIQTREQLAIAQQQWQDTDGVFTGYRRTDARFRQLWDVTHTARAAAGGYLIVQRRNVLPRRIKNGLRRLLPR